MERQSNIELLRITSMILVVLVHCNYLSLGTDFRLLSINGFTRVFAEQLCLICVNVFILISGWFGIKPKIKNILSLLFQVIFYNIIIALICHICWNDCSLTTLTKTLYFGSTYWFIPSYIIFYSLTPIANKFVEHTSKRDFQITLMIFFLTQTIYGCIANNDNYNNGYSTMSFIGLYLLARYLKIYPNKYTTFGYKVDFSIYISISLLASLLFTTMGHLRVQSCYCSPLVILPSVYFMLAFTKLSFKSKTINKISRSCFSIYLVHQSPFMFSKFTETMNMFYKCCDGFEYIILCIFISFALLTICTLIDKVRIYFWNIIIENISFGRFTNHHENKKHSNNYKYNNP